MPGLITYPCINQSLTKGIDLPVDGKLIKTYTLELFEGPCGRWYTNARRKKIMVSVQKEDSKEWLTNSQQIVISCGVLENHE